jgi:hypothetical protein
MDEQSSEKEDEEESVAQPGVGSDGGHHDDVDSLGANSIPSVAASVLSVESVPTTSLVLQTQPSQRAASKSRGRPSSSSLSSARSTPRSILNQSDHDDDEDFEQDGFQSPPAVSQSKKRARPAAPPSQSASSQGSSGAKRKKKKKKKKKAKRTKPASVNLAPLQLR